MAGKRQVGSVTLSYETGIWHKLQDAIEGLFEDTGFSSLQTGSSKTVLTLAIVQKTDGSSEFTGADIAGPARAGQVELLGCRCGTAEKVSTEDKSIDVACTRRLANG